MAKTLFSNEWTKNTEELKIYLAWFSSIVRRVRFAIKFFAQNIWKKKKHNKICIWYYHKFSVQDHLHEHYCTFEHLVGKTLVEIESVMTKQKKHVRFCFFLKHSASGNILLPSKGYLKTHFEFSFEINIDFIDSNTSRL